ncbi:MAG: glycosyltransferase family 39 protein [Saprospiraceae bacterium]|nr:glycosyltransferase family 39 protein [Saprospiraceae bacterium]
MRSRRQFLFGAFALVSILIRLPTFFPTVIDHDESTYIIIASQLLEGKIPYVDNLDVKPIGIYLVFALILKISNSIIAIRLIAALVIALSAFLIYRIHFILFSYDRVAMASGLLYVVCASLHKWSWSANTEIFFQCFSVIALYLLLIARKPVHLMIFGLVTGLGFLIKFHIAFDILAFTVFYFFWRGKRFIPWLSDMMLSFVFFLVPILCLVLIYSKLGYLNELQFAMIAIPSGYASDIGIGHIVQFIAEYYLSFSPVVLLMMVGMWRAFKNRWMMQPQWVLFGLWTVTGWLGIAITGKFFFHYYFQALPAMCLFALTWFMITDDHYGGRIRSYLEKSAGWIFCLLMVTSWLNQYLQVVRKLDTTRIIYDELKEQWRPDDRIYTTGKNILYYLLKTSPPTRYVHTSILYEPSLKQAYRVNSDSEMINIVNLQMDYYVVPEEMHPILKDDIRENFSFIKRFPDDLDLYKRIKIK